MPLVQKISYSYIEITVDQLVCTFGKRVVNEPHLLSFKSDGRKVERSYFLWSFVLSGSKSLLFNSSRVLRPDPLRGSLRGLSRDREQDIKNTKLLIKNHPRVFTENRNFPKELRLGSPINSISDVLSVEIIKSVCCCCFCLIILSSGLKRMSGRL